MTLFAGICFAWDVTLEKKSAQTLPWLKGLEISPPWFYRCIPYLCQYERDNMVQTLKDKEIWKILDDEEKELVVYCAVRLDDVKLVDVCVNNEKEMSQFVVYHAIYMQKYDLVEKYMKFIADGKSF